MDDSKKSINDPDHFWDLSALVPKRKNPPAAPPSRSVEAVEIRSSTPSASTKVYTDVPLSERPVSPYAVEPKKEPECTYQPEGSLLRQVRIYPWKNEYTYYEQFRHHAQRLVHREGKACAEADFFSYMPQYTQLNHAQLEYYFWWRTNFRNGVCLPAAYSYLLLYLYELINLDETHQDPKEGRESMLRLWLSYRENHPRLDVLIREWLCDYCLLHQLPPPRIDPSLYRVLLGGCRLKEFYVTADEQRSALSTALLLFCNNYDYTKSKFYRPDTKADYDRVLGGAVEETIRFLQETSGGHLTNADGISTVSRDAFSGAVCSWRIKRRIEVDYTSFSHTHELRYIMTDVLKYTENALRANRGIKSRLSIYSVSVPLRRRLDDYLARVLPPRVRHTAAKKQEIPAYERQYDLPSRPVSIERAAEIEALSWQTTKRLVEAFAQDQNEITPETVSEKSETVNHFTAMAEADAASCKADVSPPSDACCDDCNEGAPTLSQALGGLVTFLPLAAAADRAAQRAFALQQGLMPDAIADKINTVVGDFLGDVVLEEENGVYVIVEDYLDFLREEGVL